MAFVIVIAMVFMMMIMMTMIILVWRLMVMMINFTDDSCSLGDGIVL